MRICGAFLTGFLALWSIAGLHAGAAELVMNSCDSTAAFSTGNGSTVTAASRSGDPAIQVNLPSVNGGAIPEVYCSHNTPYVSSGSSQTYDGIRFWVKGDGSTKWGNIALWYDNNFYYRAYAVFPITTTWTEVTIPWREFYQRSFVGRLETRYTDVFGFIFTVGNSNFAGHPLTATPAMSYQVDNVRMVSDIALPATPQPDGISIRNTVAKLKARQPVKIVVMGASIAWGTRCQNPATDCWPYKLEQLLKTQYGYSNISVVDNAIGGFSSYQGASMLGWFCFDQEPIDLLITCDWLYNDRSNFPVSVDVNTGIGEIAHNYEDFFGYVRRHNQFELMNIQTGLHCEPGNFDYMDAPNAAIQNVCNAMNIYTADVYGEFKKLGQPWLTANYYTYDFVHFNEVAHTRAAEIVRDAFVAAGTNHPPVITSAAQANPSTATTGQSISFSAAASDLDLDLLDYVWDFGDGSTGGGNDGPSASHSYSAAGTYHVTVTVNDGNGGLVSSSVEVTVTASSVGGGGGGGSGDVDSDGDGVSDANEIADGTDPHSAASFKKTAMSVSRIQGAVNFTATGRDSCAVTGVIPGVAALFDPSGKTFAIDVGGAASSFVLDARGHASNSNGTLSLKFKPTVRNKTTKKSEFQGGNVPFTLKLRNGAWASAWSDEGVTSTDAKGASVSMLVDVTFAGRVYEILVQATYSAKAGKSGKFKK